MIDVRLFLFEFLGFTLKFLEVFFDSVSLESLLFDHSVTAGNSGGNTINLVFSHFTLFDEIFLMLKLLSEIGVEHLCVKIKKILWFYFSMVTIQDQLISSIHCNTLALIPQLDLDQYLELFMFNVFTFVCLMF